MPNDMRDQVAVITGASAGIGAALAQELSSRGASVVLAARRREKLAEVAGRLKGPSEIAVGDVTRRADVQGMLDAAIARFGHVDLWVNNAGRGITRDVEQLTDDDVDTMIRDNVKSALYGMQVVLPHFKARRRGAIVNVSSMLGRVPFVSFRSAYSAAKAALNLLTESLRVELAREFPEIRVLLVLPGAVATEFRSNALGGVPDSGGVPGAQSAEDVARIIADGLNGKSADIYTRPEGFDAVMGHLRALRGV